jgi:hypothetical protein
MTLCEKAYAHKSCVLVISLFLWLTWGVFGWHDLCCVCACVCVSPALLTWARAVTVCPTLLTWARAVTVFFGPRVVLCVCVCVSRFAYLDTCCHCVFFLCATMSAGSGTLSGRPPRPKRSKWSWTRLRRTSDRCTGSGRTWCGSGRTPSRWSRSGMRRSPRLRRTSRCVCLHVLLVGEGVCVRSVWGACVACVACVAGGGDGGVCGVCAVVPRAFVCCVLCTVLGHWMRPAMHRVLVS